MGDPASPRHLAALILAAACWGLGTVLSKQAVAEVSPFVLLPAQLAVSLAFLVVAARIGGQQLRPEGGLLGRLGLLNPGLAYALSLVGLTQISASLSVLIWASEPVLILLLAAAVLGERPGPALLALSGVAVGGLALVTYDPAATGGLVGITLTVAGIVACAIYTVVTRRWLPGAPSTLGVVVAQQSWALVFAVGLVVVAVASGLARVPAGLTLAGLASIVVSGLLYYGLAYWLYLSGLRLVPASVAAVSFYLIPVFGVAAATLVGERLAPVQWLGGLVVVVAVGLVTVRAAQAQPSSASASAQIAATPSVSSRR